MRPPSRAVWPLSQSLTPSSDRSRPAVPVDRATRANYPGGAAQGATLESLGAFGNQKDPPLPGHGQSRPVFEFRTLAEAEPDELVTAGMAVWDYIARAHAPVAGPVADPAPGAAPADE